VSTGVLAALRDRDRTGLGAYVELALPDVALAGVANPGGNGEHGDPGVAPALGRDTAAVLAEVLGLTDAEIGKLAATGVIPGSDDYNG
jgi:2-methylfumaryl-CoA isomerase